MTNLFSEFLPEPIEPKRNTDPVASVALEQSVDRLLDYSIPPKLSRLQPGMRVRVPLGRGNKLAHGYVISIKPESDFPKIKPLAAIDDDRVLLRPNLMELARWMSRYYVCPLGTVLESVLPSAVKKRTGLGHRYLVRRVGTREQIQTVIENTKARKRRAILGRLLLLNDDETIDLHKLIGEAGTTLVTVRKVAQAGHLLIEKTVDLPGLISQLPLGSGDEPDQILNIDQQKAFDSLAPRMPGGFSINLLLGVTGSGKTEVYLQCIRKVVEQGKQAIVLVPEIALTPQTVKRFTGRFARVAVLHSGLTQTQRHQFWQQISSGEAQVIVGARSAVFAPVSNLGIIVVDEEHEASYKQDTAPRYHARDTAIKRGQLENVPVILGSATPALETYARVTAEQSPDTAAKSETQTRFLLSLPKRVRDLPMPHVELVDLATEMRLRPGVHLISTRLETLLKNALGKGEQAILLLNRRGYSNFVYCASCKEPIHCKYCDTTMTYHRSAGMAQQSASFEKGKHTGQLHCHYCLAVNPLPASCPTCGKKLTLFGLGTQRVEEEIQKKFPDLKFARVDSDTMRAGKDYENTLAKFAKKELQVLLGTQMIAKGLDFPNVTLVGVISGDTALSLPDFRAAERTFQLVTQVAGRAGRGDLPGRVVLQTFQPNDPTIQSALKQDYLGFAKRELQHRKEVGLPPYARLARIVLRDQSLEKLEKTSEQLAGKLQAALLTLPMVKMQGPMPCAIGRIAGYFRYQIVLSSPTSGPLQHVLSVLREQGNLAKMDRIAVDVDPVSLL